MNIDLHSHSRISDGLLSPATLVERAKARGVDVLALTDHDETSGLPEACERAKNIGVHLIQGVEVSVSWGDDTVHVVGLHIDPERGELKAGLSRVRKTRDSRAGRIAQALRENGIPDALQGALSYAGNPALISRAHFARFLVAQGYVRDTKAVFEHYLVPGKPGYVPHQWASLEEAVGWIRGSGGMAVMAHPGRYRLSRPQMRQLVARFRELGGEGIEVISAAHTPEQWREYGALAQEYGLLASRASDFHGPGESKADLGSLPSLPTQLTPVWDRW